MAVFFSFLLFFSLTEVSEIKAETIYSPKVQEAHSAVIDLMFARADSLLLINPSNTSDRLWMKHILGKQFFLTLAVGESPEDYKNIMPKWDVVIEDIDKTDAEGPEKWFFLSEQYLYKSIVEVKSRNFLNSALLFYKSYNALVKNTEKYPEFSANYKVGGLFNLIVGSIPEEYNFIKSAVGISGDEDLGMKMLARYSQIAGPKAEKLEADLLYGLSLLFYSKDRDVATSYFTLKSENIRNPLYRLCYCFSCMDKYENDKVLSCLLKYHQTSNEYKIWYFEYLKASSMLYKLDSRSEFYFKKYLAGHRGLHNIKNTYLHIGWARYLAGDTSGYYAAMGNVKEKGADFYETDKQALKEANLNVLPDINILRARLLYDGGYFVKALNEISELDSKNLDANAILEKEYRRARIFHKIEKMNSAKSYYVKAIDLGLSSEMYFAPYSALCLAEIYEEEAKKDSAAYYFRKAIEINNSQYKNSIGHRAKEGLKRVDGS